MVCFIVCITLISQIYFQPRMTRILRMNFYVDDSSGQNCFTTSKGFNVMED